jgi:threonine synthase
MENSKRLIEEEDSNVTPYSLIDGAEGSGFEQHFDIKEKKQVIQNQEYPLEHRLETFEEVIDSEVGDTSLYRARNIERETDLRQIYLKFEGGNPSGTQKDRIAFAQVLDALRRGYDTIALATCGNYGVACSLAASTAGIKCRIFIPEAYHTKRLKEIVELGSEIIRVPGDYENAVVFSSEDAVKNEHYDANPGGTNESIQLKAYAEIEYEIYDELRDAPKFIAVPVSNGTTLAGIYKGFVSLYRRGKTSRIPKVIAGSSYKKNPIIQAFITAVSYTHLTLPTTPYV